MDRQGKALDTKDRQKTGGQRATPWYVKIEVHGYVCERQEERLMDDVVFLARGVQGAGRQRSVCCNRTRMR